MVQLVELSSALCRLVKNGNEPSDSRISELRRLRLRGTDLEDPNRHLSKTRTDHFSLLAIRKPVTEKTDDSMECTPLLRHAVRELNR